MTIPPSRVSARVPTPETSAAQFALDVQYYLALQPRQLPSRYLYDALGSALFDAICHLPWYRITRAELRLLGEHGPRIWGRAPAGAFHRIIELGGGSGEKLVTLLLGRRDEGRTAPASRAGDLDVHLIDVSASALAVSARALSGLDAVHVVTHQAPYEVGLAQAAVGRAGAGGTLTLFLGSNIGNFDPPGADAFLVGVRSALSRADAFLIGADLVKPERELLLAYDDPLGVTAAFNRNLLLRINRELGGDFDVNAFSHRACWNGEDSRVEMHLVSRRRQRVRVPAAHLELDLAEGESVWTESSYKYRPDGIVRMLERAGFSLLEQWIDRDAGFALTLVEAI
jgi:dimethylhistidine N-methyltransferase